MSETTTDCTAPADEFMAWLRDFTARAGAMSGADVMAETFSKNLTRREWAILCTELRAGRAGKSYFRQNQPPAALHAAEAMAQ